ncbi:hypothetical protein [Methyloversatilis discipulorum]|uniref:hypothetical protein n=1 Tax=Methyloversatilis discipulorum TaxID=1119528 RepID=UPI001A6135C9|nr:hypothetical protein [Methyloversatilis discipulorum]MBL8469626.1 hypothetical protein [Methyloversatilis discipulorum]
MIAGTFVRALPGWVLWMALAALVAASAGWGYTRGATTVQDRWDAERGRQQIAVAIVRQKQAEVTERVVTEYVDRVRVVERVADAVIREVPVYVKDHCEPDGRLPAGVRWVLNAAACAGRCPADTAGDVDGPAGAAGAPAGQQ